MKVICEKRELLRQVEKAGDFVSTRNPFSIQSNIYLGAEEGRLLVRAIDASAGMETAMPVRTEEPGALAVYGEKLLRILRALPDGDVMLRNIGNQLSLRPAERDIDVHLRSMSVDRFPSMPRLENVPTFVMGREAFAGLIDHTIFAVSRDTAQYVMTGVLFEYRDELLRAAATDNRRLSLNAVNVGPVAGFGRAVVPVKFLKNVRKLIGGDGPLSIGIDSQYILLRFADQVFYAALIDGVFPNYQRAIPRDQPLEMLVERAEILEALQRVAVLIERESQRIYLTITKNTLTIDSKENDFGFAREKLPCGFNGGEFTIALNYACLLNPIQAIDSESVVLNFTEPNRAVCIHPYDESECLHIVMPMALE